MRSKQVHQVCWVGLDTWASSVTESCNHVSRLHTATAYSNASTTCICQLAQLYARNPSSAGAGRLPD